MDGKVLRVLKMLSQEPPVRFRGSVLDNFHSVMFPNDYDVPARLEDFGEHMLHPEWLKDVIRYDVILQELFRFRSLEMSSLEATFHRTGTSAPSSKSFQNKDMKLWQEAHFRTEPIIIDNYKFFLSAVIGILQEQLSTANAFQTKLMGGVVTLLIAMSRFVFLSWWSWWEHGNH